MAGGLMQLSAWGAESEYLMGNPQITYFKIVYKRHSNFAMEPITVALEGEQTLMANENRILTCKIPRYADLLSHLYFVFDIPDIYSGYYIPGDVEQKLQDNLDTIELKKKQIQELQDTIDNTQRKISDFESDLKIATEKRDSCTFELADISATAITLLSIEIGENNGPEGSSTPPPPPTPTPSPFQIPFINDNSHDIQEEQHFIDGPNGISEQEDTDIQNSGAVGSFGIPDAMELFKYIYNSKELVYSNFITNDLTILIQHIKDKQEECNIYKSQIEDLNTQIEFLKNFILLITPQFNVIIDIFTKVLESYNEFSNQNKEYNFLRGYRFQWIRELGTNIIQNAEIRIGGGLIESIQGNWIAIWNELFVHTAATTNLFKEMIGDVPELYDPTSINSMNHSKYPTSTLDPAYKYDPELTRDSIPTEWADTVLANPYLRPPSIRGRTIYVPLCFWFTKNTGLALPLIALQYQDVEIRVELKPLNKLYTIIDPEDSSPTFGNRIAPLDIPSHFIRNFIAGESSDQFIKGVPISILSNTMNDVYINPRLIGNYVFMDETERTQFATSTHEYIIDTVEYHTEEVYTSTAIDLELSHPCSALVWFAQRDDFLKKNIYSNYTNWDSKYSPSTYIYQLNKYGIRKRENLSNAPTRYDMYESTSLNTSMMIDALQNDELPTKFNFEQFDHDIIQSITLKYNGVKRFDTQNYRFFNNLQPYQHKLESSIPGIGLYSFSINPGKLQPSGSCNMSRIQNVELIINTIPTINSSFCVHVYVMHYNEFRVAGGLGGLSYTLK